MASAGLAVQGRQVVSALPRKAGRPPYLNRRTSPRLLPDPIGELPIDLPTG